MATQANGLLKRSQAGFTLIELLVALGVASVISVLAYQTINSMVNVKESVNQHSTESTTLQRSMWRMQQDLSQLVPRTIQDGYGETQPAFQYRADTGLEFSRIAQLPTPHATGGLLRVAYRLENGDLYRLTWRVLDRAQDSEPTKVKLFANVSRFEVALLNEQTWVSNWPVNEDQPRSLPRLTQVTIISEKYGQIKRLFMGVN